MVDRCKLTVHLPLLSVIKFADIGNLKHVLLYCSQSDIVDL